MRTLVEKEIRLLLPAFAAALALAILPVWLLPHDPWTPNISPSYLFFFGIVLLALSSFGREIGLKTLPFILAQPLERARIWWTKIAVLVFCVALVFDGWWLSGSLCSVLQHTRHAPSEALAFSGLIVAVFAAGALWMTLLLRQVTAAFWLTVLIPMFAPGIKALGVPDWIMLAALVIYAATAFFLARRQFLNLQDTAWTGGVIAFSDGQSSVERSALRDRRPWAALLWKEVQLQQITLAGMGCLLVLHLGAVMLRNIGAHSFNSTTLSALELFGLLWLAVPFLAGSQSVADERKLGTMEAHLCLPVSRRFQWLLKLVVVLVIGGLLSPMLFNGAEQMIAERKAFDVWMPVFAMCMGIALAGFYGSTLTSGVVQAMAAAVLTILALGASQVLAFHPPTIFGFELWTGLLAVCIGWPALLATLLWLSYWNFGNVSEGWPLWRRNVLVLAGMLAVVFGLTTVIYHRVWECLTPLEPPHGPARLSPGNPPVLRSSWSGLTALFPDGRLWVDRVEFGTRKHFHWLSWDQKWTSVGGNEFVPGSNWVDAVANFRETVAIRSDGTLWVSERPRKNVAGNHDDLPPVEEPAGLIQFGQDTNWESVVPHPAWAMVLLKRDGTLWHWGTNNFNEKFGEPSLRTFSPRRLGNDSDWAGLLGVRGDRIYAYAWKNDGTAWGLHYPDSGTNPTLKPLEKELLPWIVVERLPGLDDSRWRNVVRLSDSDNSSIFAGLRDDGTLWQWHSWEPFPAWQLRSKEWSTNSVQTSRTTLVQIGKDSDWAEIASLWFGLAARKNDGSLWKWDWISYNDDQESSKPHWISYNDARKLLKPFNKPPTRLGTHTDWVALGSMGGSTFSLAADGSLWSWPDPWETDITFPNEWSPLIMASRKPARIENIFGSLP